MSSPASLLRRSRVTHRWLLDYLGRLPEHGLRDGEPQRLGCLEVDREVELGGALDRQLGRIGAPQDLVDQDGRSSLQVVFVGGVAHEYPGAGIRRIGRNGWEMVSDS